MSIPYALSPPRRLRATDPARARAWGLPTLTLQTRVELPDNQATFVRLGFAHVGRTAHPDHDRPMPITSVLRVAP